jgi:hypothetical protein
MLFKLIVAILGGWLVVFGWDEFSIAYHNSEPAKLSCANFVANPDKPKWVSVEDCVMYLGKFEYSHNKGSDKINSAGILVYPTRKDAEADSARTSVVVQVSDQALLEGASKNIDALNAINKKIDGIVAQLRGKGMSGKDQSSLLTEGHALEKEAERLSELMFINKPMVFKFSSLRPEYNLLKDSLAADYSVYEISSMDDKPSYFMALLKMIGGLVLVVGVVYSFIPSRKNAAT